jgi:hypothetical protein
VSRGELDATALEREEGFEPWLERPDAAGAVR